MNAGPPTLLQLVQEDHRWERALSSVEEKNSINQGGYYVADLGASMGPHPEAKGKFSLASRGHYGEAGWVLNWNPIGAWEISPDT